jgi:hypothetical protein
LLYCLLAALVIAAVYHLLPKVKRAVLHPKDDDYRPVLFWFLIGSFVFVVAVFAWAALHYDDITKLGTFGDFFGGMSNPVLSFLTFLGLLITIVMQQNATREARRDTYRQMFDSTFFQMLTLLNSIVNELEVRDSEGNTKAKGKRCFDYAYQSLRGLYSSGIHFTPEIRRVGTAWASIYNLSDFPHYFRFVFNVIRTIDDSRLGPKTKKEYVRLLRAQLSNHETGIIFYNAMTSYGENFKPLIDKYELMDNFPNNVYLSQKHKELFKHASFDMSEFEKGTF